MTSAFNDRPISGNLERLIAQLRQAVQHLDELEWIVNPAASPEYQEWFTELMQDIVPLAELLQPVETKKGEEETPTAARSKKRIPLAEVEIRVRTWLKQNAKRDPAAITRDAVAKGAGVSAASVSRTAAWKAFRQRRDAVKKPRPREIPLSDGLLAVLSKNCQVRQRKNWQT